MPDESKKVAVFWDDSFLWGLIAYRTFGALGIGFEILSADDIRQGKLSESGFSALFVPGGWAADKYASLGDDGAEQIRDFVRRGGAYIGICGGAGLALSHDTGLGLAPFGRVPKAQRLPSFSGRIVLELEDPEHPIWSGVEGGSAFSAWWPGQFAIDDDKGVRILARYGDPAEGAFVTDLPVLPEMDWPKWEHSYGINLDPSRLTGEPAVVEVSFGSGRVILSYLHFETPCDTTGNLVLLNLIDFVSGTGDSASSGRQAQLCLCGDDAENAEGLEALAAEDSAMRVEIVVETGGEPAGPASSRTEEMRRLADDFIEFGKKNFLWYWRNSWLLQWRRGVKGIEYTCMHQMLSELNRIVSSREDEIDEDKVTAISGLHEMVESFFEQARSLTMLERWALTNGPMSPLRSDDGEITALRSALFSESKRCGGLYEEIMKTTESLLLPLLRAEAKERDA